MATDRQYLQQVGDDFTRLSIRAMTCQRLLEAGLVDDLMAELKAFECLAADSGVSINFHLRIVRPSSDDVDVDPSPVGPSGSSLDELAAREHAANAEALERFEMDEDFRSRLAGALLERLVSAVESEASPDSLTPEAEHDEIEDLEEVDDPRRDEMENHRRRREMGGGEILAHPSYQGASASIVHLNPTASSAPPPAEPTRRAKDDRPKKKCEGCDREVLVNRNGSLRAHICSSAPSKPKPSDEPRPRSVRRTEPAGEMALTRKEILMARGYTEEELARGR